MWMGDVAAWAAHFRVYAIDMIGEPGLSAPSRPPLESDAYALWLEDVMRALALEHVSIIGMSLGGWLALDYATRRPERVRSLVLLCPGGVGRQKTGGEREMVIRAPAEAPPAVQRFFEFIALIQENFLPRMEQLPVFSDDALGRLSMPLMAILGGTDALLDSDETRSRLEHNVAQAVIRYLPEAGHLLPRQTSPILDFLSSGAT
jgi:pimeloyl-ACP methyl ester carboxylesterase